MRERVSDKITIANIMSWDNDIITIKAPTGAGKSYFVKNTLYNFAKANNKKILFLIHRSNCADQFKNEIIRDKKDDVIDIKTYQALEVLKNKHKKHFNFNRYQYVVCDEFHYFMGDAAYNKTTDISLNMILSQKSTIRIFMSATGDSMKKYINDTRNIKTIDYELEIKYDFIEKLSFFESDAAFDNIIKEIIDNKLKGIFFIQSAQKAYELYKKYKKYSLFNCSKTNDKYYQYVKKDKIKILLENETFEESILFSTTCLDAGVNIIEDKLKYIVVDVEDTGSLIQCIGRKRVQNINDKVYLYIKIINNNKLGGKKSRLKDKITMADFLRNHTVQEYIEEYSRDLDYSNIVYDDIVNDIDKGTKKINELMYFKCKDDINEIDVILNHGKYGYCKYLKKLFGIKSYEIIEAEEQIEDLNSYLDAIKGIPLYKKEQKILVQKMNIKRNGKILKSHKSINSCLEELEIKYSIKPDYDWNRTINNKKNKNYGLVYWLVEPNITAS